MALEVLTRSQAPYLSLGKWIFPLGSLGEGSPGDPGARQVLSPAWLNVSSHFCPDVLCVLKRGGVQTADRL